MSIVLSWHVAKFLNQFYSPLPTPLIWWSWFGYPSVFWIFGFSTVALFSYYQLYSRVDTAKNYARAAQLISYVYIAFLVISYLCDPHLDLPRSLFMSAWISTIFIVIFNRWLTNIAISKILSQYGKPVGVFLIASAERLHYLSTVMHSQPHYRIVGGAIASTAHSPIIIQAIARSMPQEVVAEDIPDAGLASQLFWRLRSMGIILRLLPSSREMMYRRGSPEVFASLPTIRIEVSPFRGFDYFFKRWFDFLFSITAIFILSPLLLIVASAIKISSPGPALFRQERMGLHGKVFHVWKFRTMIYNAEKLQSSLESDNESSDGVMFKIKKDPRVTSLGKILRRTSVDELPQLFNVLLGQMSLVGPRPLPLRDTTFFEPWHHVRHQVLPGITGLWQISGRSNIKSFDDAVRLDLHYIDNWSLNLDLEILLETIKIVCCGKGAH
ncbi:MAG: sugar transferase [Cyanobacteria bacterium P01_D01_bin.105]